jgi:excisionase family DNA binding protein
MYTMNTKETKKAAKPKRPITGKILAGYKMYNTEELADLLQVTTISVRSYIKRGKLKGQRIGRSYLVSEEALKNFLGVE